MELTQQVREGRFAEYSPIVDDRLLTVAYGRIRFLQLVGNFIDEMVLLCDWDGSRTRYNMIFLIFRVKFTGN